MIKKIFYSLVLFPWISYSTSIHGFKVSGISERVIGEIIVDFVSNENQRESIEFTHKDFLKWMNTNEKYQTKNWQLSGTNEVLLQEVFEIIKEGDVWDFHFFKEKEFYQKIPFWTVLNITSKCNLFCEYCFNDYDYPLDTRNTRKTLWLEDFKKIIDILYANGGRDIILTGWEPFSCPFLWDLLDYLKERKIFTRINTNGTLLFDKTLERLDKNYSVELMVSMHEFNNKDYFELNKKWAEKIYKIQELQKWEKKFEEKVDQIRKIKNYSNIGLDFLTILTPKNIVFLEQIYDFVLSQFHITDWHFFRLYQTGTTKWISKEMINLAIHKLYKLNKQYHVNFKIVDAVPFCVTKNTEIASEVIDGELSENHNVKTIITAEWNIQIMSAFDTTIGNIFTDDLKEIWQGDFVQKKLTNWFLPPECYDCKYKNECRGWSRMNANIFNGSYDALDPLADLSNKVINPCQNS